jgi:hypothetical protein
MLLHSIKETASADCALLRSVRDISPRACTSPRIHGVNAAQNRSRICSPSGACLRTGYVVCCLFWIQLIQTNCFKTLDGLNYVVLFLLLWMCSVVVVVVVVAERWRRMSIIMNLRFRRKLARGIKLSRSMCKGVGGAIGPNGRPIIWIRP